MSPDVSRLMDATHQLSCCRSKTQSSTPSSPVQATHTVSSANQHALSSNSSSLPQLPQQRHARSTAPRGHLEHAWGYTLSLAAAPCHASINAISYCPLPAHNRCAPVTATRCWYLAGPTWSVLSTRQRRSRFPGSSRLAPVSTTSRG